MGTREQLWEEGKQDSSTEYLVDAAMERRASRRREVYSREKRSEWGPALHSLFQRWKDFKCPMM